MPSSIPIKMIKVSRCERMVLPPAMAAYRMRQRTG
jgi:hypothetical protein